MCAKVTVIVNDQQQKNGSKIKFNTVKVGDGDSAKEIEAAQLASHGIVAKDKAGKLVTKVDGHSYGKEKVEEVVQLLLAESKE